MTTHQLQLATEPFMAIVAGEKTIESRLFDDKRKTINLGDEIVFINREDPAQTVLVNVVGLLNYRNFHDLFSHNDPRKFGGETAKWLEKQINEFYSTDDQALYGVIGIEFEHTLL